MTTSVLTEATPSPISENWQSNKKWTPKICKTKNGHLNQWAGASVCVVLPAGGLHRLHSACAVLSPLKLAGFTMIAALLWSSQRRDADHNVIMRLVNKAARKFVKGVSGISNPATFVAKAWGCEPATRGCNINGKVANTWHLPPWWKGGDEKITLRLTPGQLERWNRQNEILRECMDEANPHAAIVRKTLALTKPGPSFDATAQTLKEEGQRDAVKDYLTHPGKVNVTRDVDVQSNVSRLPEVMRAELQIDGLPVAEFDVKSAHAVLLGMFYESETGADWQAEKKCFDEEVLLGFQSIYGEDKAWKVDFLAALNQSTRVACHASEGYRELKRLFPLLFAKLARLKATNRKTVGRRLRVTLAEIVKNMLIENDADGIRSIPVIDSAVVAMPNDLRDQHRAAFRTAWRLGVPIAKKTGTAPLIEGSNGESYRFFL